MKRERCKECGGKWDKWEPQVNTLGLFSGKEARRCFRCGALQIRAIGEIVIDKKESVPENKVFHSCLTCYYETKSLKSYPCRNCKGGETGWCLWKSKDKTNNQGVRP